MTRSVFISWPGYDPAGSDTGQRLQDAGLALRLHPKTGARSPEDLADLAAGCCAAIVSTDPFTAQTLKRLAGLQVIARVGVGTDSIDLPAATGRGVAVTITPGMNAVTVAEHTLALMLALLRRVVAQDASVKAGRWDRIGAMTPRELAASRVLLIGGGTIGRAVAVRLLAFGAQVLVHDPVAPCPPGCMPAPDLDAALAGADIVSLHLPRTPETEGLLNAGRLGSLKPGALVINTARGGLLDEAALFAGLRSGHLGGAALDVFDTEPPDPQALRDVPNLIAAAHMGGLSHESIARMTASATDSVLRVLAGECPATVINPGFRAVPR